MNWARGFRTEEGKDRESIQSRTTPDRESSKTEENQEVNPFLTGGHRAVRNRHHIMEKTNTLTKKIHRRSTNSFSVPVGITFIIAKISFFIMFIEWPTA